METIVDNVLISLNSKYATQQNETYLSNVIFPFSSILAPDKNIKRAFLSLQNASIPVSFYIINEYNNRLVLKDVGGGGTHNIDIDFGNYSASTLIAELQTKINAGFPHSCVITFNRNKGKLTFTFSGDAQIRDTSSMSTVLGTGGTNLSSDPSFQILMPYPMNLLGTKKLYIKSKALDISTFDSQSGNLTNIIGTVPVTDAFYGLINYIPATETKFLLTTNIINEIDIQITDDDNNLVNFNNLNWSMTLCLNIERNVTVRMENNIQAYILSQPTLQVDEAPQEDAPLAPISETLTPDEPPQEPTKPELELEKLKHDLNQPETLSESMKQFSEALLKGSNNYTTQFRDLIKKYGDNPIMKMEIKRSPVRKMVIKALDVISLGKFEKENPYDTLWHLYILLTLDDGNILRLEKNSVLSLKLNAKDDEHTENMVVEYPKDRFITLNTLLEKTRQAMGKKYFLYNAKGNNCQDYLKAVLVSNGLGTPEEIAFIKQSTREIFNSSPDYLRRISLLATNTRAGLENTRSSVYDLWRHKTDLNFLTS
jgi:hypothetical protein